MKFQPVIVVVAYNRPRSLARILSSLKNAIFSSNARLIISIDNDEPNNIDVKRIAEEFLWPYGQKEVRYQEKHMGLRDHILQCGSLSMEYGSVIILEDDLYVSPHFYDYTVQALEYYCVNNQIKGVSLYNQPVQENVQYPFSPIYDNSDVYFMQFPSSWGQAWTENQWRDFMDWYASKPDLKAINIPPFVRRWRSENSWKKFFCAYLVDKNKFFVFPRFSLTTNFNDPGIHLKKSMNYTGQSPLRLFGQPYRFKNIGDSPSIYDVNLELMPQCIDTLSSHLHAYSYELDLYGTKDLKRVNKPFLITSRPSKRPIIGFKRALKPHEMNIIYNLEGKEFVLTRVEDILPIKNKYEEIIHNYRYFYTGYILGWKTQLYYYAKKTKGKLFKPK